jgi:hypothetical protein
VADLPMDLEDLLSVLDEIDAEWDWVRKSQRHLPAFELTMCEMCVGAVTKPTGMQFGVHLLAVIIYP